MKTLNLPVALLSFFTLTLANETALQEFISGNNLFTASVYKEILKNNNDNFLVSPFSAETVLALAQSGAKDETAQELRTSLHLPANQDKIESAIKNLQPTLKSGERYSLRTANKIYVKQDYRINGGFKKVAADVFGADLENIVFTETVAAAKTINDWVEKQTENKIHDLIDPKNLNDRTRTILINALYFKGNWSSPFESYRTVKKDFYRRSNEALKVDTMQDYRSFYNYYESQELDAKFLELSFEGEDVSMTVVLPNKQEGLAALENQIEKTLAPPKYTRELVNVALPKFKIETKLDFKDILQRLGVSKAFRDDEADLSGIAGKKGDLVINQVIQKTFIDVNEQGVEAAAATFVDVGIPLSGFFPAATPKEFVADHPFLFYIKVKDLIIFAGRVSTPKH